jgi:predicted phage terminase large subunit-like protein
VSAVRIPTSLAEVQKELSRRSFHHFFRHFAWPALLPNVVFVDNWHIHAICEHLEAVKRREIRKLVINMPFRQLKSTLVSQAFMAWDWIDDPSTQYLTASYAKDLATRDAVASRTIVESPRYRQAFGDAFRMASDQNVKTRYENDKGGGRVTTSTDASATGFGGNVRIVDDPVNPRHADSPAHVQAGVEWWKGVISTRANDPMRDVIMLVQQRLNENDTTGHVLKNERGWEHLVLPMRYEPKFAAKPTSIGWKDPRTVEGELMMPARLDDATVVDIEKAIGSYHTNAQLQQRPEPRGGIIFQRSHYRFWKALPELDEVVISVDCTFKALQTSDFVAIQAWGNRGANKYLLKRVKERMTFAGTCDAVRSMHALFENECIAVLIEDKANGSAVIETLTGSVPGVIAVNPDGGKAARAYAMQPEHEAGNIWLPDPEVDATIETFVSASSSFTGAEGGDDDEVDAMTQYVNWRRVRDKSNGLSDLLRAQAEAMEAARKAA